MFNFSFYKIGRWWLRNVASQAPLTPLSASQLQNMWDGEDQKPEKATV